MIFNKFRFYISLSLIIISSTSQLYAYEITCQIIKGPHLNVNGFTKDLSDMELTFSKDKATGAIIIDLPIIGDADTEFKNSNFDTSPQKCSPFFDTYLENRNLHFTIDLPLDQNKASVLFDNVNKNSHILNAIIRAKGTYTFLGMKYDIINEGNAGAILNCEGTEMADFIVDLQHKCTGIYTAYQTAKLVSKAKPPKDYELALNSNKQTISLATQNPYETRPNNSGQR